jgi:general secretion pathway protein G
MILNGRRTHRRQNHAFTLIEILIVVAMAVTLTTIAVPVSQYYVDQARKSAAIADIQSLQVRIKTYEVDRGKLPDTLADVKWDGQDPWGNPYGYLNFASAGSSWKGKARKDKFLVPINSTYDLYSSGKDGQSKPPLTAKASRDDIVRANDGIYIGYASDY